MNNNWQLNGKKYKIIVFIILTVLITSCNKLSAGSQKILENKGGIMDEISAQTDVDNAQQLFDEKGVPYMRIKGVGDVYQPAGVGVYALKYAGLETYDGVHDVQKDLTKFNACIKWLVEHLEKSKSGDMVWYYNFDNTYNDIYIKAPWYSAFGQALGIEALVAAYEIDGNKSYINKAKEAASVLFIDINDGGLLFQKDGDIWFEEIPVPSNNPPHILNGNMRTILALQKLYKATGDKKYQEWVSKGIKTLDKWMPLYDNGYWLGYDLNPKKSELLFRFNNPYGYQLTDLPIDKIILTDPLTKESSILDVGSEKDGEGDLKIAGNDWGQRETVDDKTIRRLKTVTPDNPQNEKDGKLTSPGTYFYLKLPSKWIDNLRSDWLELSIEYKDEKAGNIGIQMKSIAPGTSFKDMRDGDLLLTGSGNWRQWKIPVRVSDLHYWVGNSYANLHARYLEELAKDYSQLDQWAKVAREYVNSVQEDNSSLKYVDVSQIELPAQTTPIPIYSFDNNGVVRFHTAGKDTNIVNGQWDFNSPGGEAVYSPYIIATQAKDGTKFIKKDYIADINILSKFPNYFSKYNWLTKDNLSKVESKPAFDWLNNNKRIVKDSYVWVFPFINAYNDVIQAKDWQSSFSQKYVIDAYMSINDKEMVAKAANAYKYSTDEGGISSYNKKNEVWFEEVPNNTHIMNAHLTSLVTLNKVYKDNGNEIYKSIYEDGLKSLKENLHLFDTGYWVKYDLNPKKEVLFQIDWIKGEKSPAIQEITLENPQTNTATKIDVGLSNVFESYPRISGTDWKGTEVVDGKNVRRFANGYTLRTQPIENALRHNVYFLGVLPEKNFPDYFDVPNHKLIIKYKDDNPGEFAIKVQSISEGNELEFTPIKNGIIKCVGDGQWKIAELNIETQEIGWYMGRDYQAYHIQQLKEISKVTKDWLLEQYVEKWEYYLDSYSNNKDVIIKNNQESELLIDISSESKVIDSSKMYKGFEIANSLDRDPNDDYTAAVESKLPQSFTLEFSKLYKLTKLMLIWESNDNYAVDYTIEGINEDNKIIELARVENQQQYIQEINVNNKIPVNKIKVTINKFYGQQRILLRQIQILTDKK